ncbi:histidine-type phosphatase [Sphingomonas sp. R1]|uniref:histidine-type phosphatase n=1 Tax=Sphingomonas sp. R1 TaxID=399176 RepID=UPI0022249268|nr:histidine-type phosphatase [Sphingomonas sp. R1]UYY76206.1 histidine-type phosphatase [Sphingomonas sp. R1]
MNMRIGLGLALTLASPAVAGTHPAGPLVVDRVVMLMRHGVRPPTKAPAMPPEVTPERWPDWPTRPGWLTRHGSQAVARLGPVDARVWRGYGLLPANGCPTADTLRVVADSDQRTIETARAWVATLAPGCTLAIDHRPQDEPDPRFNAIESGKAPLDPAKADAAVLAEVGAGGFAALDRRYAPLLARIDTILCGRPRPGCGVSGTPTGLAPARADKRPKLTGAIDRASTAAQILLLETAEGKPMVDVGWGRATLADVTALGEFHALEFRLVARPRAVAAANFAALAEIVREGLGDGGPRVTMISGHDTNIANLGGLFDAHWQAPGFATDDPVPGGALILERLHDRGGKRYVRIRYRAQSLAQLRSAAPIGPGGLYDRILAVPGCNARGVRGLCTLEEALARLG